MEQDDVLDVGDVDALTEGARGHNAGQLASAERLLDDAAVCLGKPGVVKGDAGRERGQAVAQHAGKALGGVARVHVGHTLRLRRHDTRKIVLAAGQVAPVVKVQVGALGCVHHQILYGKRGAYSLRGRIRRRRRRGKHAGVSQLHGRLPQRGIGRAVARTRQPHVVGLVDNEKADARRSRNLVGVQTQVLGGGQHHIHLAGGQPRVDLLAHSLRSLAREQAHGKAEARVAVL